MKGNGYENEKNCSRTFSRCTGDRGQQVWAATTHYNDSSVTGGSEQWQKWVADWNQTATDFTKVSLTPGGAASELNFRMVQ